MFDGQVPGGSEVHDQVGIDDDRGSPGDLLHILQLLRHVVRANIGLASG